MHCVLDCLLVVAIVTAVGPAAAPAQPPNKPPASEKNPDARPTKSAPARPADADRFELKDGDRVVFIGNTFFEREGRYGYIETMLTTRYPGKRITFRNLGWSGDTVWGESRGYFEPEKGYQNLINLVAELRPTVFFLAYGNNEAFAGKEGLEPFIKQYNKLLDDLERFTKRIVIIGPLQIADTAPIPDAARFNANVQVYRRATRDLAAQRRFAFIDLYGECWAPSPFDEDARSYTIDGIHGNASGYHRAAGVIWPRAVSSTPAPYDRPDEILVALDGRHRSGNAKLTSFERLKDGLQFTTTDLTLPEPPSPRAPPPSKRYRAADLPSPFLSGAHFDNPRKLRVHGLPAGIYALRIDGTEPVQMRANGAAVDITFDPPDIRQVEKLRQTIIAKNQLFSHRWRPQNTTYLLGFRKHEQGQNAKEIAQFDPLIAAKEEEIFKLAQPLPHKYELIRVKDDHGKNKQFDRGKAGVEQGGK